ncbi:MAG: hypothetical protein AB8G86_02310 [Saprospiraceae bacterium]
MIHKDQIDGYDGSPSDLATAIGDLKYDALAEFLSLLATKIAKDGAKDRSRGRVQLATSLENSAQHLLVAKSNMDMAWRISAPYMK